MLDIIKQLIFLTEKVVVFQGSEDHWIKIQQNTFKNWVNAQLQKLDLSVEDLQTDFCDGLKLC